MHIANVLFSLSISINNASSLYLISRIIDIHESGLLELWQYQEVTFYNPCDKSMFTGSTPIEFADVQSAFFLIAIGIFLAIVSFSVEFFRHRHLAKRKRAGVNKGNEENKSVPIVNGVSKKASNGNCVLRTSLRTSDSKSYDEYTRESNWQDILY